MTAVGIAVGSTSFYAARTSGAGAEVVPLSTGGAAMAAVVASLDGHLVVGDEAARHPRACARDVVRRLGDPTPIAVGAELRSATELIGLLLERVLARASEYGGLPDHVVVAHPASWSGFRLDALRDALARAGRQDAQLVAAPLALVLGEVIEPRRDVPFAVLHLGGVTAEATIVTVDEAGARIGGEPATAMHTTGDDLDRELVAQVRAGRPGGPVPEDLVGAVRAAKEALASFESATVTLGPDDAVTLARSTLTDLVAARVEGWWALVARAARTAACAPSDVGGVLLVGGSARLPGLADALAARAGVAVTVVADPETAVARGAARLALPAALPGGPALGGPVPVRDITPLVRPGEPRGAPPAPPASGRRRRPTRRRVAVAVIAVLVAAVGGAGLASRITSGDDDTTADSSGPAVTTTQPEATVVAPATDPLPTSVPPTTVLAGTDPATYATDVCDALTTFASDTDAVVRQFDQDPSLAGDDLGPIRDALVDLTTRLHASAVTLLDAVVAAGPPAIVEGDQFHRELIDAVTRVRDGLAGFATSASEIDVIDPAAFAATLDEIALGYDQARADADAALGDTGLRHPEVADVLRSQPSCEGVFG